METTFGLELGLPVGEVDLSKGTSAPNELKTNQDEICLTVNGWGNLLFGVTKWDSSMVDPLAGPLAGSLAVESL